MKSFIKFLVLVILTLCLSLSAVFAVVHHLAGRRAERLIAETFAGFGVIIDTESASRDAPEQAAKRLETAFGYPVRLVAPGALPAELESRLAWGENVVDFGMGRPSVYRTLKSSGKRLVIGPFALHDYPQPVLALSTLSVSLVSALVLMWIVLRPRVMALQAIERGAHRFRAGELGARVPVTSFEGIGAVGSAFNEMAAHIQRLINGQKHLIQAVSHELRTPVARVRFDLELLREAASPREQQGMLHRIENSIDELEELVAELLDYSRLDEEGPRLTPELLDLRSELQTIIRSVPLPQSGLNIELVVPSDLTLRVPPRHFRRACRNLLSNATVHARVRVIVGARLSESGGVEVYVDDDGPGIPIADRERIFEPFVRLDTSRTRSSGGAGLGLALVHRILLWCRGSVTVTDSPLGGARFVATWHDAPAVASNAG